MLENIPDILTAVLPLLTAFCGWAAAGLTRSRKEEKALRDGVKGLLRAKVIDLGLHYIQEMRSCYDPYMALGDGDPSVTHIMKKCESLPVCSGRE